MSWALLEVKMLKKWKRLWHEAHLKGSCDVEKVHAVVARSTFWSQHVQNRNCLDHIWKLRCRKSARCCGAKHMWKWNEVNMLMTPGFGPRFIDDSIASRCQKSARRCGAKHSLKSNVPKTAGFKTILRCQLRTEPTWLTEVIQVTPPPPPPQQQQQQWSFSRCPFA